MEEFDISAAKVTIRYAIKQIVEAGLGQSKPGQNVEHSWRDGREGINANHHAKRQPEHGKHHAAVHVRFRELVVPGEGGRRLVRPCGVSHAQYQLRVQEDRR